MNDKEKENIEEHQYEEPSPEDFLFEEDEEDLDRVEKQKKRKVFIIKTVAIGVSFLLVLNVLGVWLNMFNLNALQFLRTSNELSKQEDIQLYKEAVVTIQGNSSRGTGFAVSPDGMIITNHHVVDGKGQLVVSFPNGDLYEGTVINSNEDLDLAFVSVPANDVPHLTLDENSGSIGDPIYVIGNPLMHSQIVTDGEIVENEDRLHVLKISAPIYSGNSGSPVINEDGKVIGVVYARTIPRLLDDKNSVGLAIPIQYVNDELQQLIRP
ncbi:S1C family serine protease [Alkalihalobacterium chitinilyticum]|uniref:Trypsin-like peptidase domain-containing protein n=1 Tax=Alkalihalobacterium chitinilyticum TaxID=2980103 RepID=A0ABT5VBC4_9BACI|nr:trypsin-like peptidase domain-containing protein [Alkalihalobacterium chitinilyticum]MDE5412750.1 trypsin-like peptidase domain-containing protein [Alkalihalobacterium chitinilyticum]